MTSPTPVTEEMRRAVYLDDCKRLGHAWTTQAMLRPENVPGWARTELRGPDGQLPHVACSRCGVAALVVADDMGSNYDDALVKFRARVKPGREPAVPS